MAQEEKIRPQQCKLQAHRANLPFDIFCDRYKLNGLFVLNIPEGFNDSYWYKADRVKTNWDVG